MVRRGVSVLGMVVAGLLVATLDITWASYDEPSVFSFVKELYDRHDPKLNDLVLDEIDQYLHQFPDGPHLADVLYMQAKLYEDEKKDHEALAAYMEVLFLAEDSEYHSVCADGARRIVARTKPYRDDPDPLLAVIDGNFPDGPAADTRYAYMDFIYDLKQPKLYQWMIDQCSAYVNRFPDDRKLDQVLVWKADTYRMDRQYRTAAVGYLKVRTLYPDSPLIAYCRYQQARLVAEDQRDPTKAVDMLTTLISSEPDSPYSRDALRYRGELKEKKLKDPAGAIEDYWAAVNWDTTDVAGIDTMMDIASIQERNADYNDAIDTYLDIPRRFPTNTRGMDAMSKAADVADRRFKDYGRSAAIMVRAADQYPQSPDAPDMLMKAARAYDSKLGDPERAIETYGKVVERYPGTKNADNARRKMTDLQTKG